MDTRPAEGERRAAGGYRFQYLVGAATILERLKKGDMEWVRVADPEAGRVDDLQIASTARIDAYQIKWTGYSGMITLRALVQESNKTPSLIFQLADGWRHLQELFPHHRIVVHLVTNAITSSSTSAYLPKVEDPPAPYHFAAFVEQAWKPAKRGGAIDYKGGWRAVWHKLEEASGLTGEAFTDFVNDCTLDFGTPLPPEDEDHRSLASLLFQTAADTARIVELDRTELLNRLGWQHRYKYRNVHEFEIPRFYRPIALTVADLRERLSNLTGGYVAVIGPPGSGKSTLLTRTLRSLDLKIRLIRYYAYVPESQDPTVLRGESVNFLHDVTLRLEEASFGLGKRRPDPVDRSALLEKLHEQLQALGMDYKATRRKTVILIDGLDHIIREQQPERSLLADLPLPNQIPEGVYLVLGSQTTNLDDLPPLVRREVETPERHVEMDKLSPADVEAIAVEAVPQLAHEGYQRLFELSAGHPLTLIYTIKRLQLTEGEETHAAILAEAVPYSEDIDAHYWSHWDRIQDDEALSHVLGLLARVRGSIGMVWATRWIERPIALKIERLLKPYFDVDSANRWSFFHNSFRLFLQSRTAQPVLGQSPEEQEVAFHAELAERYTTAEEPWRWEALYHLYRAGDHASVLKLATADWFREQAQALRPLEAIQTDVRLAIRSAGKQQEPLALVRLTLIAAALEQQKYILEEYSLAEYLLDLGDVSQALELVRDGETLRVEKEHALYLSARLVEMGMVREGIRLFELAEPYALLSGRLLSGQSGLSRDSWDLLKAWAKAAPRFRAPSDVLNVIEQIVVEPEPHKKTSREEATVNLQRWLGTRAAIACAERKAWSDWNKYLRWLDERKQGGHFETLLRSAESAMETEPDQARKLLRKLLERYEPIPIDGGNLDRIGARIDVAELALILDGDEQTALAWISDLYTIPLQGRRDRGLTQELRFRLYRMRYWLGEVRSPNQLVTEDFTKTAWGTYTKDNEKVVLRQLALMVTTLANLWGSGRRGRPASPSIFLREVQWILDLLRMPSIGPTGVRPEISASRPKVVDFLIQAAAVNGEGVLETLTDELVRRWDLGEWYLALRRIAIVALARMGAEKRARELLKQLEGVMHGGGGPSDRVEEHWQQAKAWLELQDTNAARVELRRMVASSRGLLDDHDYQSEVWVRWMGRANTQDPTNAGKRIRTMLLRLAAVVNEASGIRDAAAELMVAICRWSPRRAAYLTKVLQENDILEHEELFSSILRTSLEGSNPPLNAVRQAINHLLIPISSPSTENLVEALIVVSASKDGKAAAVSLAHDLANKVRAEALSSDRYTWLEHIAKGLKQIDVPCTLAEIEEEDLGQSNIDLNGRSILYLNGGTEMTLEEACQSINSVADFDRLVEQEDSARTRYFRWTAVAEAALSSARSIQDIVELSISIEKKLSGYEAVKILVKLSRQARELGYGELAESLAHMAVAKSEPVGWDRWSDGGSRIEAIRALQDVRPIAGRIKAIELYAEDIGGTFRSPNRLLPHLDEILPLLFDEIPVLELWAVAESYLNELYCEVPVESIPEIEFVLSESFTNGAQDTAAQGIADAVAAYLDHPSYVVATSAASAALSILNTNRDITEIRRALIAAADRSEEAAGRVLLVLEASSNASDILQRFNKSLHQMTNSPNIMIRIRASQLVALLEGVTVKVPIIHRPIPSIYFLELPQLSVYRTEKALDSSDDPVLMRDSARALRPFDIEARGIAEEAGINEEVVLLRAAQLLEEFTQEHSWLRGIDHIDEGRLNRFLDHSGLRVSFYKPHIAAAQRAVAYVTAEVWDAGFLTPRQLQRLANVFSRHDPSSFLIEPQPRPAWIRSIGGIPQDVDVTYSIPEQWVEHPEESLGFLHSRTPDDLTILGELSRFAFIARDHRIEEDRVSYITTVEEEVALIEDDLAGEKDPFFNLFKVMVAEYVDSRAPVEHFVVANNPHDTETPGAWWIGFNPVLGFEMGWQPASEDIFGWKNENGDLMVTSMWWKDGNLNRYDRNKYCSIGEGWVVIATELAYKMISDRIPPLSRQGLIRRRVGFAALEGRRYRRATLNLP